MALSAAKAATRACRALLLTARVATAGLMDQRDRVVGEQGVLAPGEREVKTQVAAGLFLAHRWRRVPESDALIERGEHA
jgi:hypothetical protein